MPRQRPSRSSTMHSDIRKAFDQVAALRDAVFTGGPTEIEECLPGLETAAEILRRLRPESSARTDLEALRKELSRAARLIEHGDRLWRGWAGILGSAAGYTSAGYTSAGEPIPLAASGQLSVRG
jgi:hypothetical protein